MTEIEDIRREQRIISHKIDAVTVSTDRLRNIVLEMMLSLDLISEEDARDETKLDG